MKAETYLQSVELHGSEGRIVNCTDLSGWTGAQWKHANHNLGELYLKYCGKGRAGKSKPRDDFNSSVYYYYRSGGVDDHPGHDGAPVGQGAADQYLITFWFFFGYSRTLAFGHQGDWESMSLLIDATGQDQLTRAWYTKHGKDAEEEIKNLERAADGRRVIGYFSKNRHAIFRGVQGSLLGDSTGQGHQWDTRKSVECLLSQPWQGFRGKWGPIRRLRSDGPYGPVAGKRTSLDHHCNSAQSCECTV